MRFESDTDRLLVSTGPYVLKFAETNPTWAIGACLLSYDRVGLAGLRHSLSQGVDARQSPQWFLGHGVVANRREVRLAGGYPTIMLATHSLCGGLVNVQSVAEALPEHIDTTTIFARHLGRVTEGLGRMFGDPSNFGVVDGYVRIINGGSEELENALTEKHVRQSFMRVLFELGN